jgi:hypothetical protein
MSLLPPTSGYPSDEDYRFFQNAGKYKYLPDYTESNPQETVPFTVTDKRASYLTYHFVYTQAIIVPNIPPGKG